MRWSEEIELLLEEMERVKRFFLWKCADWKRAAVRSSDPLIEELGVVIEAGRRARALRQANLYQVLHDRCEERWKSLPKSLTAALSPTYNHENNMDLGS